ncbi:MAG: hypothetical protein CMM35_12200 [Rhodospirillaceae bacterium]|jgi:hypothetical protein|nr:hypothetical protein [Rhodospirillaceae bacterium]|tara:strand:+ start:27 stop:218 length:192 start_codon:yes stop_codon:yes gene_type:complete
MLRHGEVSNILIFVTLGIAGSPHGCLAKGSPALHRLVGANVVLADDFDEALKMMRDDWAALFC